MALLLEMVRYGVDALAENCENAFDVGIDDVVAIINNEICLSNDGIVDLTVFLVPMPNVTLFYVYDTRDDVLLNRCI